MVSYAEYSEPSADWLEFVATVPAPPPYDRTDLATTRVMMDMIPKLTNHRYDGPADCDVTETTIPARDGTPIQTRVYTPRSVKGGKAPPIMFYFHPGGWIAGNIDFGHPHMLYIASQGVLVISVNYRKCPEVSWNTPQEDGYDVFSAVLEDTTNNSVRGIPTFDTSAVYVFGSSAGAQIATAVTILDIEAGKEGRIKGLLLHGGTFCDIPLFPKEKIDGDDSFIQNKDAPFINAADIAQFALWRGGSGDGRSDRYLSPLVALEDEVLARFPKTYNQVYGMDCLRDGAILFSERLGDVSGEGKGRSVWDCYQGYAHCMFLTRWAMGGTQRSISDLDRAAAWMGLYEKDEGARSASASKI